MRTKISRSSTEKYFQSCLVMARKFKFDLFFKAINWILVHFGAFWSSESLQNIKKIDDVMNVVSKQYMTSWTFKKLLWYLVTWNLTRWILTYLKHLQIIPCAMRDSCKGGKIWRHLWVTRFIQYLPYLTERNHSLDLRKRW